MAASGAMSRVLRDPYRKRIVEWRDERVGGLLPTELKTWGQIKFVWR